ncbi:MAG TPA: RHS repeat-associated core domain-containing protein, partial [Polyangiaceae bacterium LLY-WYZ-15_(1-7)]|nr:RHS repeat-associated core domain-containing protein [Polyangiaceae bacterium LLY-WYZ-15_(1-7)]
YAFAGDGEALGFSGVLEDALTTTEVDAWGQAVRTCAGGDVATGVGCLGWAELSYEPAYGQLVIAESTATGRDGAGGWTTLTSTATWDRGLGAVVSMADPNGLEDRVTQDGLGRLSAQIPPPATGCPAGRPTARFLYEDADPEARPVALVRELTELRCTGALGAEVLETVSFVSGSGEARATLSTGDAPGEWIRDSVTTRSARGAVRRSYQPDVFTGAPTDLAAVLALPSVPYRWSLHDAFDRVIAVYDEHNQATWTHHHALSTDVCDPLDNDPEHFAVGTCTTQRVDGHGRVIDRILRNRQPGLGGTQYYRLWMRYRADGSMVLLERAETTGDQPMGASTIVGDHRVERSFVYDSVGRRIASTDPDTDSPLPGRDATNRTWRYLFNRGGDLVAVRDPRGCGQNFFYDHGGRLVGEQYVSCGEAQGHELPVDDVPAGRIAMGETTAAQPVDVRHYFDRYAGTWAPDPSAMADFPATTSGVLGRLTASVDRSVRMVVAYDGRGQAVWSARQLAMIPAAPSIPSAIPDGALAVEMGDAAAGSVVFDEANEYVVSTSYDHGGRGTAVVLPEDPSTGMRVAGTMAFNHRGLPSAALAHVIDGGGAPAFVDGAMAIPGASIATQPIVSSIQYLRDGLVGSTTYADGTQTRSTYDARRRPTRMWTTRTPTAPSDPSAPLGAVSVVADQALVWDAADNLKEVDDERIASEWPVGHRPQSVWAAHDALYRVVGVEMDYGGATTDPATDWRAGMAATWAHDPMRTSPAPVVGTVPGERVMSLTWDVDWLGNVTDWSDDAHHFYERSLGATHNGADIDPSSRPSALYLAADLEGPPSDRGGWVEMDYGESGNLEMMTVHGTCADAAGACVDPGGPLETRRSALRTSCRCATEQHYQYRWDELNRLAEARRYDRSGGAGSWQLAARQRHRYDQGNQRRVKQTLDTAGERIALMVVPGDMERRGVVRGLDAYEDDPVFGTETQYLVAGARMVWRSGAPTPGVDRNHRITVPISDLLGTTSAVIDIVSGELLEHGTYYPNGARETYRSSGDVQPEPVGFTGKEGDEEVGLTYFGERYLVPRLGRWATPDPLAIHEAGGGEALNSYHYVSGNLLQVRDPLGLEGDAAGPVEVSPEMQSFVDGWIQDHAVEIAAETGVVHTARMTITASPQRPSPPPDLWAEAAGAFFEGGPIAQPILVWERLQNAGFSQEAFLQEAERAGNAILSTAEGAADMVVDPIGTTVRTVEAVANADEVTRARMAGGLAIGLLSMAAGGALSGPRVPNPTCFTGDTEVASASGETRRIDAIRVGDRVGTYQGGSASNVDATWRAATLRLLDERTGVEHRITLLRPRAWFADRGVRGAGDRLWMELEELAVSGWADVEAFEAPEVEEGPGRAVLATVEHASRDLYELSFANQRSVRATGLHPLYSLTRNDWVQVANLADGEVLQTREGHVVLENVRPLEGTYTVYNLEVEGDHEYLVTDLAIRAHNQCRWTPPSRWRGPSAKTGTFENVRGNSRFTPHDPERWGLQPGEAVNFVEGVPDFGPWATDTFIVPGMTGYHRFDMPHIRRHMARQFNRRGFLGRRNWTNTSVRRWLSENQLTPHHYRGQTIQIVPWRQHKLPHQGSAAAMRDGP